MKEIAAFYVQQRAYEQSKQIIAASVLSPVVALGTAIDHVNGVIE